METVLEKVPKTRDELVASLSDRKLTREYSLKIISWYDTLVDEGALQRIVETEIYKNAWEHVYDPGTVNCDMEQQVFLGLSKLAAKHTPPCTTFFSKSMSKNRGEWTLLFSSEYGDVTYLRQVFTVVISLVQGRFEVSVNPVC